MAKGFVGYAFAKASNGGDATVTLNSGLQGGSGSAVSTGDLVFVHGCVASGGGSPGFPGDWTPISSGANSAGTRQSFLAYKKMGASPDASVTFTGDGDANSNVHASAIVFSGADYDSSAGPAVATGSSTNPDPAALTPSQANSAIVVFAMSENADISKAVSTNYTELLDGSDSVATVDVNDLGTYVEWRDGLPASAENPSAIGTWSSGSWRTVTIALNEPGGDAITGTVAQTLPKLTQAALGVMEPDGTIAQVLPSVVQSASGGEQFTGTIAQALPNLEQAAIAVMQPSGTAAQTLPSIEQVAEGEQDTGASGTVAQTLPNAGQAASGAEGFTGTATSALPRLQQAASGVMHAAGTIVQTLARLVQSASGQFGDVVEAVAVRTFSAMRRRLRGSRRRR